MLILMKLLLLTKLLLLLLLERLKLCNVYGNADVILGIIAMYYVVAVVLAVAVVATIPWLRERAQDEVLADNDAEDVSKLLLLLLLPGYEKELQMKSMLRLKPLMLSLLLLPGYEKELQMKSMLRSSMTFTNASSLMQPLPGSSGSPPSIN